MEQSQQNFWRKCSSCKKPLAFSWKHYVCSVSTCNGQRTGYVFCSVECFERHLPGARHRQAGAIEKTAPTAAAHAATQVDSNEDNSSSNEPVRVPARIIVSSPSTSSSSSSAGKIPREVLIIASRLKEYITARSDYNTSGAVMDVLSDHVRILCDRAIDNARAEGRKTVLDRDFDFLKKASDR